MNENGKVTPPRKILVVEDENLIAMEIQDRLKKLGYDAPVTTPSGEEGIKFATQIKPDLVLMDINLNGSMDGITAAKQIRQHLDIPVVFLTAYSDTETLESAKLSEPYGFIIKPLKEGDLNSTVEMALYKHAMEKRLKAKERWFATTLKSVGDGIITTNLQGSITFMNTLAESLTGWKWSAVQGQDSRKIFNIVNKDDKTAQEHPITTVLKQMKPIEPSDNSILLSRENGKIPIDYNAAPIRDEQDKLRGVVLAFRDISDRLDLETRLRQSQKLEAIGILARRVANDFNNHMTSIQLGIDLSLMEIDPDDPAFNEIQKHMKEIHHSATHAADLAQQLLMFSRKHPMNPTSISINELVKQSLVTLQELTSENIQINMALESHLWNTLADQVTLERVILNLVANGRDAMPSGGLLSISTENMDITEEMCKNIEDAQPGKYVCLSIQDTGGGMPEETLEHIFEPFFSTKAPDNGTGLGLSVVYGIIKQHKGWVNVESILGHGTTLKVYLPAHAESSEKIDIMETKDIRTAGKGENILVVEDEKGVREFLSKTLTHVGYSVFVAEDSKQALEIFKREKGNIQMVLSDVVLPGINGVELVEKLLVQKPDLQVVLCSGDTDDKCLWSEIEAKGYHFLDKPFNIAMLANKVHEAMNH